MEESELNDLRCKAAAMDRILQAWHYYQHGAIPELLFTKELEAAIRDAKGDNQ